MTATSPSRPTSPSCSAGSPSAAPSRSARPATGRAGWTPSPTRPARTITVDVAFGGTAGLNTGQQPEPGRRQLERRHADRRRRHAGSRSPTRRTAGVSSRGPSAVVLGTQPGTGNFQRDPFGLPLPVDRAGRELLRLQERADARSGPDPLAAALRRRGPRGDDRHGRRAGHGRQDRRHRPRRDAGHRGHHRRPGLHGRQLGAAVRRRDVRRLTRRRRSRRSRPRSSRSRPRATTSSTSRSRRWRRT